MSGGICETAIFTASQTYGERVWQAGHWMLVYFCLMMHVQGRICFQLTDVDVGEFSRRFIGSSCTLSILEVAQEKVMSGEIYNQRGRHIHSQPAIQYNLQLSRFFPNDRLFPNKNVKYEKRVRYPSFKTTIRTDTRQPCSLAYQAISRTIHFLPLPGIPQLITKAVKQVKNLPLYRQFICGVATSNTA